MEEVVHASERRYRALSEHASDLVSILDDGGIYRYASPSHLHILGYRPDDLLGTTAFALLHPNDTLSAHTLFAAALNDGTIRAEARLRVRHADGSWRTLDLVGHNRLDDPDIAGFILNSHDITDHIQTEEALRSERARLELLLESARSFNSTLDSAGILHRLTARLVTVLDAAGAVFTDVDYASRTMHSSIRYAAPGRPPLNMNEQWEPLSNYPHFEHILESGVPWHGHLDDADFPASERAYLEKRGMRTELLVPIMVQGTANSVLEVYWDSEERIDAETVAVCSAIAEQAGLALANARLYATEAELRRRAEVRARRMEHVQRVGERLKADLEESEIGQRVVMAACEAVGFASAVLNLVDEPENAQAPWRVVATHGIPPDGVEALCAHPFTVSDVRDLFRPEFLVSRSYFIPEESESVLAENGVTRWRSPERPSAGANGWRGGDELLVPLTENEGGQLIGFLSVGDPHSNLRPEREEIELLEIFADQAVVALRNAHLLANARRQAERDSLTGLFNHRAAHLRLETELSDARRSGAPVGLLALDMDGFKLINDTYGHPVGDLALRHVAGLLGCCTRASDTAARLGGDEFLLILPGSSQEQSVEVAQRLVTLAREAPLCLDGADAVPLRLSVGVACCPDDADQPHTLLTIADKRLYEAKRAANHSGAATRAADSRGETAA